MNRTSWMRRGGGLLALALGIAALVAMPAPGMGAAPTPGCWTVFPTPLAGGVYYSVEGFAALAPDNIWAAGYEVTDPTNATTQPLILHWNGAAWQPASVPAGAGALTGISAVSANDIWALGYTGKYDSYPGGADEHPLAFHWDGTGWTATPAPATAGPARYLGVAAVAANDVWAVGAIDSSTPQSLLAHWDGAAWRAVAHPDLTGRQYLTAVAAAGPNAVWAAGYFYPAADPNSRGQVALERWDGQQWRVVYSAAAGTLEGLALAGPDDVWVTGARAIPIGPTLVLTAHWNGTAWQETPDRPNQAYNNATRGITAAPNDVWTVGDSPTGDREGNSQPRIEHWDGQTWSRLAGPVDFTTSRLRSLARTGTTLWVGGPDLLWRYAGGPCAAPSPSPTPAPRSRTFPQTGKTVTGLFLDYWNAGGGLPQQGYPISDPFTEVSDLNGKPYTVQYFERAVFEYHPENAGTPYAVLLSQLGTFRYHQKYPAGAPGQVPNQADHGRYFPPTGHWVGGKFRDYWEAHGGLAQQGYPLSDEFTEVSDLDGKPYTVQYFERAIFEYHPENAGTPYVVLLSQLGAFQARAKYPAGFPAIPPTPLPGAP
jgi:hypothetical protein